MKTWRLVRREWMDRGAQGIDELGILKEANLIASTLGSKTVKPLQVQDLQSIIDNDLYQLLPFVTAPSYSPALERLKRFIDEENVKWISFFRNILHDKFTLNELEELANHLVKARKAKWLDVLKELIVNCPQFPLRPFFDLLKAGLSGDQSDSFLEILSHIKSNTDVLFELSNTCKTPKTRLMLLSSIKEEGASSLSEKNKSLLFESFKKETVEAAGEVLARLIASAGLDDQLAVFLKEVVKQPKPKPFHLKAIYFFSQKSEQLFRDDLKAILRKEAQSPSSNDALMTLMAIAKDYNALGLCQKPGYFLNDLAVLGDGKTIGISNEKQLILCDLLAGFLSTRKQQDQLTLKAVERLVEIYAFGDVGVHDRSRNCLCSLKSDLKLVIVNKISNLIPNHRIIRLLRMLAKEDDAAVHDAVFKLLLSQPAYKPFQWLLRHIHCWTDPHALISVNHGDFKVLVENGVSMNGAYSYFEKWLQSLNHDDPSLPNQVKNYAYLCRVRPQKMGGLVLDNVEIIIRVLVNNPSLLANLNQEISSIVSVLDRNPVVLRWRIDNLADFKLLEPYADLICFIDTRSLSSDIVYGYMMIDRPCNCHVLFDHLDILILEHFLAHSGAMAARYELIEHFFDSRSNVTKQIQKPCRTLKILIDLAKSDALEDCLAFFQHFKQCPGANVIDDADLMFGLLTDSDRMARQMACEYVSLCASVPDSLRTVITLHGLAECTIVQVPDLFRLYFKFPHLVGELKRVLSPNTTLDVFKSVEAVYEQLIHEMKPLDMHPDRTKDMDLSVCERVLLGEFLLDYIVTAGLDEFPFDFFEFAITRPLLDPSPVSMEPARVFYNVARDLLSKLSLPRSGSTIQTQEVERALAMIERAMASPAGKAHSEERRDIYKTWLICLMAQVSSLLAEGDERRQRVLSVLLDALRTPSDAVQDAAGQGLVPLLSGMDLVSVDKLYEEFKINALKGAKMADRRGGAYGLAALFKAKGLAYVCQSDCVSVITPLAMTRPKDWSDYEQGALFIIECASKYLGPLFEPLLPELLPFLLAAYSSGRSDIREAAMDATACIVRNKVSLSTVKLILPVLFKPLDDDNSSAGWRNRMASLDWLGSMAGLFQSGDLLSVIVPRLSVGLSDAHPDVQRAARDALGKYGQVLKNPEIRQLYPHILAAMADPPVNTPKCLDKILSTSFTFVVDGASIALLAPILTRALRDRSSSQSVKMNAAQVIGNLGLIIDPRQIMGTFDPIIAALLSSTSDAVPSIRSVAARVIGILCNLVVKLKSGLAQVTKIEQDCLTAIADKTTNAIDRAGRAECLAEIMAQSYGPEETASRLLSLQSDTNVCEEGLIRLIGYLPKAFAVQNQSEQLYDVAELGTRVLPRLLCCSCDDSTIIVGDVTLRVSPAAEETVRLIIKHYALYDPVGIFGILLKCVRTFGLSPYCRLLAWQVFLEDYAPKLFAGDDDDAIDEDGTIGDQATADVCPSGEELKSVLPKDMVREFQAVAFLSRHDPFGQIRTTASAVYKAVCDHPVRTVIDIAPIVCLLYRREHAKAIEDLMDKMPERVVNVLLDAESPLVDLEILRSLVTGAKLPRLMAIQTVQRATSAINRVESDADLVEYFGFIDRLAEGLEDSNLRVDLIRSLETETSKRLVAVAPQKLDMLLDTLPNPDILFHTMDTLNMFSASFKQLIGRLSDVHVQCLLVETCDLSREDVSYFVMFLGGLRDISRKDALISAFLRKTDNPYACMMYPHMRTSEHYNTAVAMCTDPVKLYPYISDYADLDPSMYIDRIVYPLVQLGSDAKLPEDILKSASAGSIMSLCGLLIRLLSGTSRSAEPLLDILLKMLRASPDRIKPFHPQLVKVLIKHVHISKARHCIDTIVEMRLLSRPQLLTSELERINTSECGDSWLHDTLEKLRGL